MPHPDRPDVPARAVANAAEALWGRLWQSEMARELQLELRRVQRLAAAARDDKTYPVPRGVLEELLRRLDRKMLPLQRAYEDLKLVFDGGA